MTGGGGYIHEGAEPEGGRLFYQRGMRRRKLCAADRACDRLPLVLRRERARELAQGLLMALVRDLGEVPRQLEAHALALTDRAPALIIEPLEEIADGDAQDPGDLEQPAGRDAIDAALVLMRLLIGHADEVGELLLRQPEHDPAFADARTDMTVDVLSPARRSFGFRRTHGFANAKEGWEDRRRMPDRCRCEGAKVRTCAEFTAKNLDLPAQPWPKTKVGVNLTDFNQFSSLSTKDLTNRRLCELKEFAALDLVIVRRTLTLS